jgi:hypothetical protein
MIITEIPPPSAPLNTNGVLDPGDVAELAIATTNSGGFNAANAAGTLTCSSPYITVHTGYFSFGDIAAGATEDATFTVSVSPDAPINTSVTFTYTVTSGLYTAQKQFTKKIGIVVEDFETGDFSLFPWDFGGNKPWVITNVGPFEGIYSIKSGFITDNLYSDIMLQRNVTVSDSISFYFKTSSEQGYDFLKFFIDGTSVGQWSGETPWTRVAFPVTVGNHQFKWQYIKDNAVSNGSDCAWVDYVGLPTIVPAGVNVAGTVTYANAAHSALADLTLQLKNSGGAVIKTTTTNVTGNYLFTAVPPGNYSFQVTTTKPWGGVSAADVLLYRKHIASISQLSGIYLASGDVNVSGTLTAADVLLIKKRIATVTNSFQSGDWLFNHTPFTVATGTVTQNFNGITYGDANGSYIPSADKSFAPRRGMMAIASVVGGKREITVPVYMTDVENLGAFQFSVQYDAANLTFDHVAGWNAGIDDVTVGTPAPGILTFVWAAGANGVSVSDGILCNLHFRSGSTGGSALSFTDGPTPVEFTDYDGNSFSPGLIGGAVKSVRGNVASGSSGITVYPNPNSGRFYLHFEQDKTALSIRVVNTLGVVVYEEKNAGVTVSQTKMVNLGNQPDGIYMLSVDDGQKITMQKVVIKK